MRIVSIEQDPILEIRFLNAGRGQGGYYEDRLPMLKSDVEGLPQGLEAVIVTADLQGRETFQDSAGGPLRLLGEVLPEILTDVVATIGLLDPQQISVLLAGDFYTVSALDKRGGSGDVTGVWHAFAQSFKWVVGVAGNHDTFGPNHETRPSFHGTMKYLDGEYAIVDELRVGGVGDIIGNPRRLQRRTEEKYLEVLELLLLEPIDGPDAPSHGFKGSTPVREIIERHRPPLVVRGHCHWSEPLIELSGGVQVLNVDARAVVLRNMDLS